MNTALKLQSVSEESKGRTTKEKIENTYTDELILGICTPIGSLREPVIDTITQILKETYKYEEVVLIKLSDYILQNYSVKFEEEKGRTAHFSELMHKIKGGDFLRDKYKNNSILVELAIKRIREDRIQIETQHIKGRRVCYIIDSIKNIEELQLLRAVYRDIFYLFSIFSPEPERISYLTKKGLSEKEANQIIDTDDYENSKYGQNVRDTFVDGDFFVRSSELNRSNIQVNIRKYFHLIFNSDIITPTYQETAMYSAKSAAGNSSCLSRQVGATITDKKGVPVVQGWNDVPKFGGNLYRDSEEKPMRCKELGYCSNVTYKNEIFDEIIDEIEQAIPKKDTQTVLKISGKNDKSEIAQKIEKILRSSKFKNIIEYSRSIHAEMHAIVIGSQLTGDKMVGGDLFCTTYPCHNCARHIVLAGIKNIFYIEPYKKSLCLTLHNDSLTEDESDTSKVRILLYDGVAPRRYLDFFSMNNDNRKNSDGTLKNIEFNTITPKNRLSLQAIPELENQAIHALTECGFITIEN